MADARGLTVSLRLGATTPTGRDAEFAASGTVITFRGFLAAYEESRDDDVEKEEKASAAASEAGRRAANCRAPSPRSTTTPPARHRASLMRALEERGIDRPVHLRVDHRNDPRPRLRLQARDGARPSFLAFAVTGLLEEQHFGRLVDYSFTAQMEDDLDRIAAGEQERVDWLRHFYFGGGEGDEGLHALVSDLSEIDARAVNSLPARRQDRAPRRPLQTPASSAARSAPSVPEDMAPDELTIEKAEELLAAPSSDRSLGVHPSGERRSRSRRAVTAYVTEALPEGATEKPRTASALPVDVARDSRARGRGAAALAAAVARRRP